jgi:hypothetical protein
MILLLLDILRNHGPNNPNSPINRTTKRTPKHRLRKRRRKSNPQTRNSRPDQADQQHKATTTPFRIRNPTPRNRRRELGRGKSALENTRLGRNVRVRQILIKRLELVEHVRLQRGDLKKIEDPA